jgi:hypothetical protein
MIVPWWSFSYACSFDCPPGGPSLTLLPLIVPLVVLVLRYSFACPPCWSFSYASFFDCPPGGPSLTLFLWLSTWWSFSHTSSFDCTPGSPTVDTISLSLPIGPDGTLPPFVFPVLYLCSFKSPIHFILKMEAARSSEIWWLTTSIHGVTTQQSVTWIQFSSHLYFSWPVYVYPMISKILKALPLMTLDKIITELFRQKLSYLNGSVCCFCLRTLKQAPYSVT